MDSDPQGPHSLKETCNRHLAKLQETLNALRMAVVCTTDGFPVAIYDPHSGKGQRATAMASTLNGLTQTISRELSLGRVDGTALDCAEGLVLCRLVPNQRRDLVLFTCTGTDDTYGQALWAVRNVVKYLAEELNQMPPMTSSEHEGTQQNG